MSPLARILLFVGIGLAVLISGLWISGGKKENYSSRVDIQANPKQIFPYLTNPEKLKAWMVGLEQVDEPIPPKTLEGSDFDVPPELARTVVYPNGKKVRFNDKVLLYTEGEILSIRSSNSGNIRTAIFQLEPIGKSGTQFSYEIRVTHTGLGRLLAPLRSSSLRDQINTEIRNLKELVEKNEPKFVETEEDPVDPAETTDEQPSDDPIDVSGGEN